ncbi:hypothetical protein [Polaribacter sargassicola]|uniref:hypothetical protein n=1 Tax=Polaribacter sargassicola TaxID=2836891 RepID=UPI001F300DF7|nr:hypothetical protein [Polaribacter sp. DS7-9]MCG1036759.1 hypothetical protein [Polaribacter sp. DS7-9]
MNINNKKKIRHCFFIIILLTSKIIFAHNPDLSNILISKTNNGQVVLQINSSLTAFQQEVNFINGDGAYKSPEEFRNLVIKHFRNSFSIIINKNDTLQFTNPKVFLGHDTKFVTEITGLPENINSIKINNEFFKDIYHNQTVIFFLLDGFPKQKYTLSTDNNHQLNITLEDGNWIHLEKETSINLKPIIFSFGLLVIVLIIYFLNKRKR